MPEYLTPGVYIEEIDIGPKPIEGVSTSTAGFVGPTERGPISPKLITSFEEFKRKFGSFIEDSYLAYAVDGFFRNGGKRCYLARIYSIENKSYAQDELTAGSGIMTLKAVGPGDWGNRIFYKILDAKLHDEVDDVERLKFFKLLVYYFTSTTLLGFSDPENPTEKDLEEADVLEEYDNLSINPTSSSYYRNMVNGISNLIAIYDNFRDLEDETGLERPGGDAGIPLKRFETLSEGTNSQIQINDFDGEEEKTDDNKLIRTGLVGLRGIEDISLVCAPDDGKYPDYQLTNKIINECDTLKDRFAVVSTGMNVTDVSILRTPMDNKYGAIYFPWINVFDPVTGSKKSIPPAGHILGVYARTDTDRGVHKAPGNETLRGIMSLQVNIDKDKQGVLNPRGINVIRNFPGRGNLVWGVRTISKDPMWKYVNVRRLFIFIEKSVERSTQWAVFEPNNERLWSRVKASLTQFLTRVWKDGALMGTTPEEAFFVKVDRTTMTQNDIDNGKLIVVVGIAPTKPAEFVIFRFAQTAAGSEVEEL